MTNILPFDLKSLPIHKVLAWKFVFVDKNNATLRLREN